MEETGCGTLVVLDDRDKVAGILTDRDLAIAIGKSDRNPSLITAQEAMTENVYTCSPDDRVSAALERMADEKVRRLPVVTPDGTLKGMLSIDDITLWGVQHGVTRKELVRALRAMSPALPPAPQVEMLDLP
jgi:CBS domain-containing protein